MTITFIAHISMVVQALYREDNLPGKLVPNLVVYSLAVEFHKIYFHQSILLLCNVCSCIVQYNYYLPLLLYLHADCIHPSHWLILPDKI